MWRKEEILPGLGDSGRARRIETVEEMASLTRCWTRSEVTSQEYRVGSVAVGEQGHRPRRYISQGNIKEKSHVPWMRLSV